MSGGIGWLVHPSVRGRTRAAIRHAAFTRQHLASALIGIVAAGAVALRSGPLDTFEIAAFGLLIATALPAAVLRFDGRMGIASGLSTALLSALVGLLMTFTGGLNSFLIAWLAVVPAEAALSGDRRVVLGAFGASAAVLAGVAYATFAGLLPPPRAPEMETFWLAVLGIGSAVLYAGALAVRTQTAFRIAEDAAHFGEMRYQLVAENASDLITRHAPDGTILFASPASTRLIGIAPGRLTGTRLDDALDTENAARLAHLFESVIASRTEQSLEFPMTRGGSGGDRVLELRARAAGSGENLSIIAVTRDVTERHAHERSLVAAREAAETANRAKSAFLANMSHELRTPLNAIIGFSEIIRGQTFGPLGNDRYGEYAALIAESGTSLLRVLTDVLKMAEIESGNVALTPEEVRLKDLVAQGIAALRPEADSAGVRIDVEAEDHLPAAYADPRASAQIFHNILSNAIRFSPADGRVQVSLARRNGLLAVTIADQGPGIASGDLERIGTPFERAGRPHDAKPVGAGVGLAVARALTALQGGALTIESAPGTGTRVTVTFPALQSGGAGVQDLAQRA